MIGESNFFELAFAAKAVVFGTTFAVAPATVVRVLVKVPAILAPVKIANRTKGWFVKGVIQ